MNPDLRSRVVNYLVFLKLDRVDTTFGIGYFSSTVFEFNFRKSITNQTKFATPLGYG